MGGLRVQAPVSVLEWAKYMVIVLVCSKFFLPTCPTGFCVIGFPLPSLDSGDPFKGF